MKRLHWVVPLPIVLTFALTTPAATMHRSEEELHIQKSLRKLAISVDYGVNGSILHMSLIQEH